MHPTLPRCYRSQSTRYWKPSSAAWGFADAAAFAESDDARKPAGCECARDSRDQPAATKKILDALACPARVSGCHNLLAAREAIASFDFLWRGHRRSRIGGARISRGLPAQRSRARNHRSLRANPQPSLSGKCDSRRWIRRSGEFVAGGYSGQRLLWSFLLCGDAERRRRSALKIRRRIRFLRPACTAVLARHFRKPPARGPCTRTPARQRLIFLGAISTQSGVSRIDRNGCSTCDGWVANVGSAAVWLLSDPQRSEQFTVGGKFRASRAETWAG